MTARFFPLAITNAFKIPNHAGILDPSNKDEENAMPINLTSVLIEKPEEVNLILGQAHFIKTVEDVHEALVTAVPGIKFGLAFCEASGPCLVRWSGTDSELTDLAKTTAHAIGAGHSFLISCAIAFPLMCCLSFARSLRFARFSARPPMPSMSFWPKRHKAVGL